MLPSAPLLILLSSLTFSNNKMSQYELEPILW